MTRTLVTTSPSHSGFKLLTRAIRVTTSPCRHTGAILPSQLAATESLTDAPRRIISRPPHRSRKPNRAKIADVDCIRPTDTHHDDAKPQGNPRP